MTTHDLWPMEPGLTACSVADAQDNTNQEGDEIDESAVVVRGQPEIEVYPNRYNHVVIKMHADGAYGEEQFVYIHPIFVDQVIAAMKRVKAAIEAGE